MQKYSTQKKIYVWWHYHWKLLFVILASLLLLVAVLISQFGKKQPDYQIGVISSAELPVDTQDALVRELTAFCEDVNHDGKVLLQLNSYRAAFGTAAVDNDAYDQMSGIIKLYSDTQSDQGPYIFLFNDPQGFEDTTLLLQNLDGSVPEESDSPADVSKMCYSWTRCPVLTGLSLGSYKGQTLMDNIVGESQDILADFYIGRRKLTSPDQQSHFQKDEELWTKLTLNAIP